jgi:hypothetical protein
MSLSRSVRTSVLASIAVISTGIGVAVAAPSALSVGGSQAAPQAQTAATTTYNGLASQVAGTFGSGGTVSGTFAPLRSYVSGSQTWVQGDLTMTLRRSTGQLLTGATRHNVALPVNASGAGTSATSSATAAISCPILHLVLGPLNLNLLGLVIHLNRVVLDITAQSGPGNLLGNLLCAVAHLLDRTSPSVLDLLQLSNALNRIISILS